MVNESFRFAVQKGHGTAPEAMAVLACGESGSGWSRWIDSEDIERGRVSLDRNRVPVGSVEFVRAYAKATEVNLPLPISYPRSLVPYLSGEPMLRSFSDVPNDFFVKPAYEVKKFTGGIKSEIKEPVLPDTKVWCLRPTIFIAEWRIYVVQGRVLGWARYDANEDDCLMFDADIAWDMVSDFEASGEAPAGYSVDVGITRHLGTLLVEVNDGWALGFYQWGSCSTADYARLLGTRWKELCRRSERIST